MEPTTYAKGDRVRVVTTPAEKVNAEWEGFAVAGSDEDLTRGDLQAQAKALGIPANQSSEKLQKALSGFTPDVAENASDRTPDLDA